MEDLDDATADAILALQLQDLAEIAGHGGQDSNDPTDMNTAANLFRHELVAAAMRIRDHQLANSLGTSNDDNLELYAAMPSNTPLFDQLQNQNSSALPSADDEHREELNILPPTVHNEPDHSVQDQTSHVSAPSSPTGFSSCTPSEANTESTTEQAASHASAEEIQHSHDIPTDETTTIQPAENTTSSCTHPANLGGIFEFWRWATHVFRPVREASELREGPHDDQIPQQASDEASVDSCLVCGDDSSLVKHFRAPCGDSYCHECLSHLFESAMKDDSLFPPQCCDERIPFDSVEHLFDSSFSAMFHERAIELGTGHRTYCADPSCSTFIKAEDITDDKASCPVCSMVTCVTCKSTAHEGDCPEDPAVKSLMALAETEGYQQCHRCRRMIELTFGCNHMMYVVYRLLHDTNVRGITESILDASAVPNFATNVVYHGKPARANCSRKLASLTEPDT